MYGPTSDNVIPLISAAIAHRDRLLARVSTATAPEAAACRTLAVYIDHWLTDIAGPLVVPACWRQDRASQ